MAQSLPGAEPPLRVFRTQKEDMISAKRTQYVEGSASRWCVAQGQMADVKHTNQVLASTQTKYHSRRHRLVSVTNWWRLECHLALWTPPVHG